MMLNNFIFATERSLFVEQLEAGNILDEAVVFIEDTNEIWTHGCWFAGLNGPGFDKILKISEQELSSEELEQVRVNLRFAGKDVSGIEFEIDGDTYIAGLNAGVLGDYANNIAVGESSVAEGSNTVAQGSYSHAEGYGCRAVGSGSHVEGYMTTATGDLSHAEGERTVVSSYASHAEGTYFNMNDGSIRYTTASGYASHAEGAGCHASGQTAHAEGGATLASGKRSHAEGLYTVAAGTNQHVHGKANVADAEGKYVTIVGNGSSVSERSNAYTLDWNGNAWYAGKVKSSGEPSEDNDLCTVKFVKDMMAAAITDILNTEV